MKRLFIAIAILLLAGNAWPSTYLTDHANDFNTVSKTNYDGTVDVVTDGTSPDPSNAWRFTLPNGTSDGAGIAGLFFGVSGNEVWVQFYFKFSSGFNYGGTGTKFGYIYVAGANQYNNFFAIRSNSGSYQFSMTTQGNGANANYFPNVNTGTWYTDQKDTWHKAKFRMVANSGSSANGIWQAWIDDVQVSNYSNVLYDTAIHSWDAGGINVVWGGGNGTLNQTEYMYIDLLTVGNTDPGGSTTVPNAPVLISPGNAVTGLANPVTFSWQAVAGATVYYLQIDDNSDFSSLKNDVTTSQTSYTTGGFDGNTTYYWRVRAGN